MKINHYVHKSPIGVIHLFFFNEELIKVELPSPSQDSPGDCHWFRRYFKKAAVQEPQPLQDPFANQLDSYFRGKPLKFPGAYRLYGSDFQKKVWDVTAQIPYGETSTYKEIGEKLGIRAYQGIGQALKRNPIPLLIPCHRVLGTHDIGGFAGGRSLKILLLRLEKPELDFAEFA